MRTHIIEPPCYVTNQHRRLIPETRSLPANQLLHLSFDGLCIKLGIKTSYRLCSYQIVRGGGGAEFNKILDL